MNNESYSLEIMFFFGFNNCGETAGTLIIRIKTHILQQKQLLSPVSIIWIMSRFAN